MWRTKLNRFVLVFFIGLFLFTLKPIFLWLLAGSVILLHVERSADKKALEYKDISLQIAGDARKYGLRMPRRASNRSLLKQIYCHYNRSVDLYPQLEEEYADVINEMWLNLAEEKKYAHWNQVLSSVLAAWPKQKIPRRNGVGEKLKQVSQLTKQWEEAKSEALANHHV